MRTQRWQDWVMLVFGVWLFITPFWMAGYASTVSIAAWNAYVLGVLVGLFAIVALASPRPWEEWVELVLGIWLLISPFVLAFSTAEPGATLNAVILGVLIIIDSLWALGAAARSARRFARRDAASSGG